MTTWFERLYRAVRPAPKQVDCAVATQVVAAPRPADSYAEMMRICEERGVCYLGSGITAARLVDVCPRCFMLTRPVEGHGQCTCQ
jgi:hypothetical protein